MKVSIVNLSYNTQGKGRGGASGPAALIRAGLVNKLSEQGPGDISVDEVKLTPEEEAQYGGWNRVGVAGGPLLRQPKV